MSHKRQNTGEIYGAPRGADPIYYSTTILCRDEDDTGSHGDIALFDESRTVPILPSPNLYEVAVDIPKSSINLLITSASGNLQLNACAFG